jgi:hypothetical protein
MIRGVFFSCGLLRCTTWLFLPRFCGINMMHATFCLWYVCMLAVTS